MTVGFLLFWAGIAVLILVIWLVKRTDREQDVSMSLIDQPSAPHGIAQAPERVAADGSALSTLIALCRAYASNDEAAIARLEPMATRIGEDLNRRGGIEEMRRVFSKIPPMQGKRTLEMHWGGIGEWRG